MRIFSVLVFFTFISTFGFSNVDIVYRPNDVLKDDSIKVKKRPAKTFYDTSAIFRENWENQLTFSYKTKSFKASKTICFTDSIHGYSYPIEKRMTSGFGKRHHSHHNGIDIPLNTGDKIVAVFDGKVRYAKYNSGGFGNLVIIRHVNGLETYYAHLSRIKVKPNQIVKAGQVIGLGGNTGRSYGAHLHFEVRYQDKPLNPEMIFDTQDFCLREDVAMVGELTQKRTIQHRSNEQFDMASTNIYRIEKGDTLSKIAQKTGKSIDELCDLNGISRSSVLQIGQKLRIN